MVFFEQSRKRQRAFTLIEILIVLTIISMIMALGLPAISRITYQKLNSTARKFVGMVHTIRSDSILLNNVYRLVIDFDRKAYWVESQREFKLLNEEEEVVKKDKKSKKGDEEPPSNFIVSEKYSKQPIPLPSGIAIDGVVKEREGLKKEGLVYIHFFPNGYNEQALIFLNREGVSSKGYTLFLRPTLGKVEVLKGEIGTFAKAEQTQ